MTASLVLPAGPFWRAGLDPLVGRGRCRRPAAWSPPSRGRAGPAPAASAPRSSSPGRAGANTGSSGRPATALITLVSSSTLTSAPVPMFQVPGRRCRRRPGTRRPRRRHTRSHGSAVRRRRRSAAPRPAPARRRSRRPRVARRDPGAARTRSPSAAPRGWSPCSRLYSRTYCSAQCLADAVRRLRQRQHVLQRRDRRVPAVDHGAGRGEQHPGADGAGRLEHVHGADDVRLRVQRRVRNRDADVDLGGQVADQLGPEVRGQRRQRGRHR